MKYASKVCQFFLKNHFVTWTETSTEKTPQKAESVCTERISVIENAR